MSVLSNNFCHFFDNEFQKILFFYWKVDQISQCFRKICCFLIAKLIPQKKTFHMMCTPKSPNCQATGNLSMKEDSLFVLYG